MSICFIPFSINNKNSNNINTENVLTFSVELLAQTTAVLKFGLFLTFVIFLLCLNKQHIKCINKNRLFFITPCCLCLDYTHCSAFKETLQSYTVHVNGFFMLHIWMLFKEDCFELILLDATLVRSPVGDEFSATNPASRGIWVATDL